LVCSRMATAVLAAATTKLTETSSTDAIAAGRRVVVARSGL
jgi:hypothetical protein